jgi:hypothetical protein
MSIPKSPKMAPEAPTLTVAGCAYALAMLPPKPASTPKLLATREAIVGGWMGIAERLDAQGEIVLAGDVRYFANYLPAVLTDREQLAKELLEHVKEQRAAHKPHVREQRPEIARTR